MGISKALQHGKPEFKFGHVHQNGFLFICHPMIVSNNN